VDANSTTPHLDQPESDRLIRFLRQFQLVTDLFPEADRTPAEGLSSFPIPGDYSPSKRRRSRPTPPFTVRWWSRRTGYPISTLYAAIEGRHLRARRPQGSSYRIKLEDFEAWHDGGASSVEFRPSRQAANPALKLDSSPPAFRHVRWSELPDETPREADGS